MIIDLSLTKFIDGELSRLNLEEQENHISSNKLTASYLWQPKRFQLLKYLGVPTRAADAFGLRKFKRGNDVEDYLLDKMDKMGILVEKQKEVEYRGVIGVIDALVDSDKMQFKRGVIPHEIKSVTNRNFKWIKDKGDIGWHYHMQACFYAVALEVDWYGLDFIASDDLREHITLHETRIYKKEIDTIISEYQQMIQDFTKNATVPKWACHDKWMENPQYSRYDEFWMKCSDKEFVDKLQELGV